MNVHYRKYCHNIILILQVIYLLSNCYILRWLDWIKFKNVSSCLFRSIFSFPVDTNYCTRNITEPVLNLFFFGSRSVTAQLNFTSNQWRSQSMEYQTLKLNEINSEALIKRGEIVRQIIFLLPVINDLGPGRNNEIARVARSASGGLSPPQD